MAEIINGVKKRGRRPGTKNGTQLERNNPLKSRLKHAGITYGVVAAKCGLSVSSVMNCLNAFPTGEGVLQVNYYTATRAAFDLLEVAENGFADVLQKQDKLFPEYNKVQPTITNP